LRRLIEEGVVTVGEPDRPSSAESGVFFGFPPLDTLVRGGLGRSLHLFEVAGSMDAGSAVGFIVSFLFNKCSSQGDILWVGQSLSRSECGAAYGPGLQAMGLDPARILLVDAAHPADVLWAVEEGVGSGAVSAVVGEIHDPSRALDLTATRRIALRSEQSGVPVHLLVTGGAEVGATAARTRWRITAAPSRHDAPAPALLGAPVWRLELLRNRDGPCAERLVGFCPRDRRFFEPAARQRDAGPRQARQAAEERGEAAEGGEVIDLPPRAPGNRRRA
jgi:protein ImuA